jgi:enterochelin esterase-like enzyme
MRPRVPTVLSTLASAALALTVLGSPVGPGAAAVEPTAPTAASARASAGTVSLDLSGRWRFSTGDDPSWAEPGFDDSAWEQVQVPEEGGQDVFDSYDGYAWFRLSFRLPAEAQGTPLVAALGGIDDADATYLNGVEIGHTGEFPPDSDSQWFEPRLYPVPAGAPNYGGRNVLAVRMNDFTGGGGWYQGPVGLFSKDALRTALYGLRTSAVSPATTRAVQALLRRQSRLVEAGRWTAYRRTLAPGFFHDGDTPARRVAELQDLTERYGPLRLRDTEVEVVRDRRTGDVVADTNRSIVATRKGRTVVVDDVDQDFLHLRRTAGRWREVGNRSRFFMDTLHSDLEGHDRDVAVYLPPAYLRHPERRFPTVYLFHGINGGAAEWQTRDIEERIDRLVRDKGVAQSVVVMPDAESLWYVDTAADPWRSMFVEEMVPFVDEHYRTVPDRSMRAVTGVSMGGHGAFTISWAHPEIFSSIATHMGALSFPPLAGTPDEVAAHSGEAPNVQVNERTPEFLGQFRYYVDACEEDDFRFDDAARAMDASLTAKGIDHTWAVYPTGIHNDACWVPHLVDSFRFHTASFEAAAAARSRR